MEIGTPQRVIIVEPLELPGFMPERTDPNSEPTFVPNPEKEPEKVS